MSKAGEPIKQHTHKNINQGGPLDPDIFPGFQRPVIPMLKGECEGCPEYYCDPDDAALLAWSPSGGEGACIIPTSPPAGESTFCASDGDGAVGPGATVLLYVGAVYSVHYHAVHAAATPRMTAHLLVSAVPIFETSMGSVQDPGTWGPALSDATVEDTAPDLGPGLDVSYDAEVVFSAIAGVGTDATLSELSADVRYVSGVDPRFVGFGGVCPAPKLGQHVRDVSFLGDGVTTSFTTTWHYARNSLSVFASGLDWITEVTETSPASGAYELAYAPTLGSTVTVRYRRAP